MFNKSKGWIPGLVSKPKNPRSLEHLKFLYNVLCKNQTVTEQNRGLLVETNRSIAEILIWGDQNDSSVFDFFLEKNMLSFFLRYMRQKCGRLICVQLLQTLNILFDNISNETSLYYLLSNNHINSIIEHRFDFSDEEVMAYYISFLKTLSLKLNKHTIHFFYNEHTNDFALYTEAIKFFNHSESMVRIAVRTITLNVYKVYFDLHDVAMLRYIRDRTAAPYFSNLVWFVGNHILDLDICVRNDADHQSRDRLASLVAEHLDHLHYVNDILSIDIDTLNDVLTDQLLNRLLIPLYVYSLTKRKRFDVRQRDGKKHVSSVVSLFLLSQVFLIIKHTPLVRQLAEIILQGDVSLSRHESASTDSPRMQVREFSAPDETLEEMLDGTHGLRPRNESVRITEGNSTFYRQSDDVPRQITPPVSAGGEDDTTTELTSPSQNSTDEEKMSTWSLQGRRGSPVYDGQNQAGFSLENRPYLESVFNALECTENDYEALFALCLLYAMGHNDGIHQGLMDSAFMPTERSESKANYSVALVERLIRIITLACQHSNKVRLATLELSILLLKQLVYTAGCSYLQDRHLASIENARECSTQLLRNFYKSEEIFLDMYEDEYRDILARPLNVEYLTMDSSILLTPTGTPLTGIEFSRRLPCGEVERARRAIRVFFLVRDLSLTLLQEEETQLPLTKDKDCVKVDNILDLNNSDLIACTIVTKERKQERRFLVIDTSQMILVEPDIRRLGWGIVTFVGFLQNIEVTGDKEDSRSLHITVHKSATSHHVKPVPQLSGRFIFDDHIRCMAAKQRLTKGRMKARQHKMQQIERLLDIPTDPAVQGGAGHFTRTGPIPGRSHPVRVSSSPAIHTTQSAPQFHSSPSAVASSTPRRQHSVTSLSQGRQPPQPDHGRQPTNLEQEAQGRQPIHVEQGRQSVDQNTSLNASVLNENDDEVEIAEEATSEMAFQTLHHADQMTPSRHETGSHENSPTLQEIPLEDLSRKHKSKKKQLLTRARLTQSRLSAEIKEEQSRSHSQSPSRKHGDGSTSRVAKPRGRSTSLTAEGTQTESRSRSGTPEQRVHSESSPLPPSAKHLRKHRHKHSQSTQVQTNLTVDIHAASLKDPNVHLEDVVISASHSHSPKTLVPSQSPTVSLLSESATKMEIGPDSPQLVPPAEVVTMQTSCDNSSVETDNSAVASTKGGIPVQKMEGLERPVLGLNVATSADVELSQVSVKVQKAEDKVDKGSHSASEQLTKLAQMVQHYKFDENTLMERETSMSEDSKT